MLKKLEYIVKIAITFSLVVMVLLVFLNAVMRYAFNSGITQTEELARYFFIWTVFLGAVLALKNNMHVGVDLVVGKLKGVPKKVVMTIADLASLFALAIMFLGGLRFTATMAGVKSTATELPMEIVSYSIVAASLFMALIIIWKLIMRWRAS